MAKNLQAGLRQSIKASRKAGVTGAGIFSLAPLDLRFALQKTLDPRVTFTRASSGTYVGSDGVLQSAVTNLLTYSEQFDNAAWTKGVGVSVAPNTTISPVGTLTADTVTADSGISILQNINSVVGTSYTNSAYVKAGTATSVMFRDDTGAGRHIVFNPSTGVITATSGTFVSTPVSQPLGDGWYRYSMTYVADTTSVRGLIRPNSAGSAQTFIAWGAQIEAASTAGEYIPTTSTINSAPRFDHNPTTGESLGLLVEEARTNSVTNNTMVGAVAGTPGTLPTGWGTFVSPTGLTRTIVGIGTVNGINYIDVRFSGTPSSTGEITLYLSPATTATLAQAWTSTAWLSLAGGSTSNIGVVNLRNFELNSGAYVREIGTSFVSSISSDFVRRQNITTSFGASANQIQLVLSIYATAAGTPIDITLRIGLPQLEQGAFATSVIPTTTATATRAADGASITGPAFSSFYNQTEGTVFADAKVTTVAPATSLSSVFALSDGTTNNRITVYKRANADTSTRLDVSTSGSSVAFINAGTFSVSNLIAVSYRVDDFAISLNGLTPGADTLGTLPTVSRLNIGSYADLPFPLNGTLKRLTYWGAKLPNLQALTQP